MEIRQEDLDAAVDAGVIDRQARDRLLVFLTSRTDAAAGPDNESFRLLTGFNDIFVTLACVLLLVAVGSLVPPPATSFAIAGAAWGLSEYFTRRRRMALPSIVLLLAFVASLFNGVLLLFGGFDSLLKAFNAQAATAVIAAGAVTVAGAVAHWIRFRVPITLAAGALALVILFAGLVAKVTTHPVALFSAMLIAGLLIFAVAMRYDMQDLKRLSRNTDIAFWLHLLAAPLIVHPIFTLTGLTSKSPAPGAALVVLLVYLILTAVALSIDRRALLVSALFYVLWALNGLFAVGQVAAGFGLTALILGSFLVMLSAAWSSLRRRLLAVLPDGWASGLPPSA